MITSSKQSPDNAESTWTSLLATIIRDYLSHMYISGVLKGVFCTLMEILRKVLTNSFNVYSHFILSLSPQTWNLGRLATKAM